MFSTRKLQGAGGAAGPAGPWNLSGAVFSGTPDYQGYYVGREEIASKGIFLKPDGTKMYITGTAGDDVNEFNLSTAWDITTATFLQSFSVATEDTSPEAVFFKPDGLKMYVLGGGADDINEYNLSTAWNVTTASYLQTFSVVTQDSQPKGIFFKPDGTKMYMVGFEFDNVNEYNLSTAWDISTASYVQAINVNAQNGTPNGIFFTPDGLKMYMVGSSGDNVYEYNLSTAWNVTTAIFLQSFEVSDQEVTSEAIFFKPDGTRMYMVGSYRNTVYQYDLSTAWDLSTAAFFEPTTNFYSGINQLELTPTGIFFKPDGTAMYVVGSQLGFVRRFNLSIAWDITTASYINNFGVSTWETIPQGIFFKPDGLKMYIIGSSGDDVNEFNLGTAWSINTSTFLQSFSVATEDTSPRGIFFKPDGTKFYIMGWSSGSVYEYNLSTAWNVATASYLQNFSLVAQESTMLDLFFRDDGLKMYTTGDTGEAVYEYDLTTAWDISTTSYVQSFSVIKQSSSPESIFFKPDGTKFYIVGDPNADMFSYDII